MSVPLNFDKLGAQPAGGAAYLAPRGFESQLAAELGAQVVGRKDRLFLTNSPARPSAWVENLWLDPFWLPIPSIKGAAKLLKSIQRNWINYPTSPGGREKLISSHLPPVSAKPLVFPTAAPTAPLGSWSLWEPNLILASASCSSAFANGEVLFVEDKQTPPNRAYLKLWEALTRFGELPKPGHRCFDLGASPGGWTWVLASLGADVVAVDKAPLDEKIAAMPTIQTRQESAFGLDPRRDGPVDYLCSDIICYPEKLYNFVSRWIEAGAARNYICTLKFQGDADYSIIEKFRALPGSEVCHLFHNKHEVTWMKRET